MFVISNIIFSMFCIYGGVGQNFNDSGFELLYTSNKESIKNLPIVFDGELPPWIKGTLIKNGPGLFEEGPTSFQHPLDGYAKLSKVKFAANNSVYFSTEFLQTRSFIKSEQHGKITPYLLFGKTEPSFSPIQKLFALMNEVDNTNINVYKFPSGYRRNSYDFVALSDYWHLYKFDINNLGPTKKVTPPLPNDPHMYNYLPLVSSAHPLQEYGKKTYINFVSVLNPFRKSSIQVVRIHTSSIRENIVTIDVDRLSYMHSFGLTQNYAVLFADPLFLDFRKAVETVELLKSIVWEPESNTTVYVVNLNSKLVLELKTQSAFHLHHANSFEENNKLYVDFVVYPDIQFLSSMQLECLKNASKRSTLSPNAQLIRYEIDVVRKTVSRNTIRESLNKFINRLDFPVINEIYRFRPYCYVYGIVMKAGNQLSDTALVKKDLCMNQDKFWQKANHYPSEPIFIADPHGTHEDDGVLLTIVLDGILRKSYVLVLNSKDLNEVSKAYLPLALPLSIHGRFFGK